MHATGVCDTPLRKLKKNASKYVSTHLIKKYIDPCEGFRAQRRIYFLFFLGMPVIPKS
ncbi:Uncharacterised protein [Sphingobacterium mizutaii]|uniref:Uncharacterized protein n=1 Tax=Sphingobacterium mizutaii TaxID=1010 RepID=A0AAJ5BZA6_9SPHI|nr:Uncharacterised protein [Sphingobacterium mizutaii]